MVKPSQQVVVNKFLDIVAKESIWFCWKLILQYS
jgi:hypothetical protein